MSVDLLVSTTTLDSGQLTLPDGRKMYDFLGVESSQHGISIRIEDLVGKVFDDIQKVVDFECTVELELSGSLTLTGGGEMKYIIFNVSGDVESTTSMTFKLTTTLAAKK